MKQGKFELQKNLLSVVEVMIVAENQLQTFKVRLTRNQDEKQQIGRAT